MELKQNNEDERYEHDLLLIVPYGIETIFICFYSFSILLLIVPYGIETILVPAFYQTWILLLMIIRMLSVCMFLT